MPVPKHCPIIIPVPRTPSPPESCSSTSSSSARVSAHSPTTPSSDSLRGSLGSAQLYSNTSPRSRRPSPPQILLGAIDENSGAVLPDTSYVPGSKDSPVTKLHVYSAFLTSKKKATLASNSNPPPNEYAMLVGPNGERFTDLRMNRKALDAKKGGLKRFMCFG